MVSKKKASIKNTERNNEIYRLYLQGMSFARLSELYNLSNVRICNICRETGKSLLEENDPLYELVEQAVENLKFHGYSNVSKRVYHALKSANVSTFADVVALSDKQIYYLPMVGATLRAIIKETQRLAVLELEAEHGKQEKEIK